MPRSLKILFIASEIAPLVKTGGLADVAQALPLALRKQGHDVRLAMPLYGSIPKDQRGGSICSCIANLDGDPHFGAMRQSVLPDSGIPLYLIEYDRYFDRGHPYGEDGGEYQDNLQRFCFFSFALLECIGQLDWEPDVIHCNDWHTAPVPVYLKTRFKDHAHLADKPCLFTIHNMGYQGDFAPGLMQRTGYPPELFSPNGVEFHGRLNLMKGGILFADKVNTVSSTYALEIQTPAYGHGLDGVLRTRKLDLSGITNGIDYTVWNPKTDPHIKEPYSPDDLAGKKTCKTALQERFGLPVSDAPLFGIVSRLVWQKGIDLIMNALPGFIKRDLQLIVLGSGEPGLEDAVRGAAQQYPEKVATYIGYNEALSHQVYAGIDFFLMPSRDEPCGLSQMYSLAYGAIPVVRKTGGLADTVEDATPVNIAKEEATGIVFRPPTAEAADRAIRRALGLYEDTEALKMVRKTAMSQDLSWARASREYVKLYQDAIDVRRRAMQETST